MPINRSRRLVVVLSVAVPIAALCTVAALVWLLKPLPFPPAIIDKGMPWESQRPIYGGKGTLVAFMEGDSLMPGGPSVRFEKPLHSAILRRDRPLLVYLPEAYRDDGPALPVIFALHGYSARPQTWASLLIPPLERAIAEGAIPPTVVVMPDLSISGSGRDDPATWYDDRSGNFCINSNVGRFEDHFFQEIVPFVSGSFNVRRDPGGVVLMGSSMGGYGAIYYALRHPSFSRLLVAFYPAADLRYGIRGNKLADYDPQGYSLISSDNPRRIVNGSALGGIVGVTEKWMYYPVLDSDRKPGEVWTGDEPVWKRLSEVNPVEMLDAGSMDLSGQRYYILVGSRDDFNFDAHLPLVVPRLRAHGASVFPEDPVVPGGRHKPALIAEHLPEVLAWLGQSLRQP
jgi:S-formylglutathione hydrolase FrmB